MCSLTGSCLTSWLHRNLWQIGVVRFELTVSCFQNRRISRLSYTPSREENVESRRRRAGQRADQGRFVDSLLTTFSPLLSVHFANKHPAGVEPAHPTWQAGRLLLHHGCSCVDRIVKELPRDERVEGRKETEESRATGGCAPSRVLFSFLLSTLSSLCGFAAQAPGGTRTHVSALRVRSPRR